MSKFEFISTQTDEVHNESQSKDSWTWKRITNS
jgi:hypothetical protein